MIKRKILVVILIVSALTVGLAYHKVQAQEKNITVKDDTKNILATKLVNSKIEKLEKAVGCTFVDDEKIVISKENKELKSIKIDTDKLKTDIYGSNLYLYDSNKKIEKGIGDTSKFQQGAMMSPDKKYMFYTNEYQEKAMAYITDAEGNTVHIISDSDIDEYDLFNASWINNEELIIPCHNIKGFAIINVDGKIEKIKDVENGIMGTQDPLNGLSIVNPTKVGDKIYYVTMHNGFKDNNKLKVYNIKTKETKEFIKDEIREFIGASPDKENILFLGYNSEENKHDLMLTNLEGNHKELLFQGTVYGVKWCPDGTKIGFISYEEDDEGVYIIDAKTKERKLVLAGKYNGSVIWSPSGNKLMVNSKKPINDKKPFPDEIDITTIVTFE